MSSEHRNWFSGMTRQTRRAKMRAATFKHKQLRMELLEERQLLSVSPLYVDDDASGDNNGTSWPHAYNNLQEAFDTAIALNSDGDAGNDVSDIWVADGTYLPTTGVGRDATFTLPSNVAIYGAFAGTETATSQRTMDGTQLTILSGDLGVPEDSSDNAYNVIYADSVTGTVLDGVVISDGNADRYGGGIYLANSDLSITDSTIKDNHAEHGGGVVLFVNSTLELDGSTVSGNTATYGAGLAAYSGSELNVLNSTVSGNVASGNDGGIRLLNSVAQLTHTTVAKNVGNWRAGILVSGSSLTMNNTIVADNVPLNGTSGDIFGAVVSSSSHNLVSDSTDSSGLNPLNGNLLDVPSSLIALADNGGQTKTHGLLETSLAVDAAAASAVAVDQRSELRPIGSGPDIGALESDFSATPPVLPTELVVSTLDDTVDMNWGPGQLSLREALELVSVVGDSTIEFNPSLSGTIALKGTALAVADDVEIIGPGADVIWVDAGRSSRVFDIASGTTAAISGLTITGGYTETYGGGIWAPSSQLTLDSVVLRDNIALQHGGGLAAWPNSDLQITNSVVANNWAQYGGGLASYYSSTLEAVNTTISANTASGLGGGVRLHDSPASLINCTIYDNTASNAAGINNGISAGLTLHNTILAGNRASGKRDDIAGSIDPSSSHNIIGSDKGMEIGPVDGQNGNIVGTFLSPTDPRLEAVKDANGKILYFIPLADSPALDSGDNALVPSGVTTDQRGAPRERIKFYAVDRGAIELQTHGVLYVDDDASGGAGTIADPFESLQDALAAARVANADDTAANDIHEIHIADGVYTPLEDPILPGPAATYAKLANFSLVTGVGLFGGYDANFVNRDGATRLSGDLGSVQSYSVVVGVGVYNATIDGVTISDGNAQGGEFTMADGTVIDLDNGGGMNLLDSDVRVSNVTFRDNTAAGLGGGLAVLGDSDVRVTESGFTDSTAGYGGGLYVGPGAAVNLSESWVANNTATEDAGAFGSGIFIDPGFDAGFLTVPAGSLAMNASVVSGNAGTGTYHNVYYTFTDNGENFVGEVSSPTTPVFVDDDWAGKVDGEWFLEDLDPSIPGREWYKFGVTAFADIQDGIDGVSSGGTVNVLAGLYEVDSYTTSVNGNRGGYVIDKPLTLAGAGATADDPATSSIISLDATMTESVYAVYVDGLNQLVDGVTISGFRFDGDPEGSGTNSLLRGVMAAGNSVATGWESVGVSNLTVEDNYFVDMDRGIVVRGNAEDIVVNENTFTGIGSWYAIGMSTGYWPHGGSLPWVMDDIDVTNNTIADSTALPIRISNYRMEYGATINDVLIDGNVISDIGTPVYPDAYAGAIESWGDITDLVISDNSITNIQDMHGISISAYNYSLPGYAGSYDGLVITENTIDGVLGSSTVLGGSIASAGIMLQNGYGDGTFASGVTIDSTNSVSNAGIGVYIAGESVTLDGVTLTDNTTGVQVAGDGDATITGETEISGGTTGILVDGPDAVLNFIAASPAALLSGQADDYIILANGAMAGEMIDATSVVFDGDTGSSASLAKLFAIEDMITHGVDDTSLGVVYVKADNLYVTDSGVIQNALDVANTDGTIGDTVTVEAGTYNENLNITSPLTLVSADGRDATTIQGSEAGSAAAGGGNVATVCIFSDSVHVGTQSDGSDGFEIIGYDVATPAIEHAAVYYKPSASTDLSLIGNTVTADGEGGILGQYGSPANGLEIGYNNIGGKTYVGSTVAGDSSVQFTVHNVPRSLVYFSGNTKNIEFHNNTLTGSVGAENTGVGPAYYYNTGATIDCNAATSLAEGANIHDNTFGLISWAALRARGPYSTLADNTFDFSEIDPSLIGASPEGIGPRAEMGAYLTNTGDDVQTNHRYLGTANGEHAVGSALTEETFVMEAGVEETHVSLYVDSTGMIYIVGLSSVDTLRNIDAIEFASTTVDTSTITTPLLDLVTVDDDWDDGTSDPSFGDAVAIDGGYAVFGVNAFAAVQDGIDAVAGSGTVNVYAGTYAEDLTIGKELSLIGPNAGIDPNTVPSTRVTEADLVGDTGASPIVSITADNVTVNGFTIDGSSSAAATGVSASGISNGLIANNTIQNLTGTAVSLTGASTVNSTISNNLITDVDTGVNFNTDAYADITDNVIDNVRTGILAYGVNNAYTATIEGNVIGVRQTGLYMTNNDGDISLVIDDNAIQVATDAIGIGSYWVGIRLLSVNGVNTPIVSNNVVDGTGLDPSVDSSGIRVWRSYNNGADISGGTISNVDVGIAVSDIDPYWGAGNKVTTATIDGVAISNAEIGILIESGAAASSAIITGNTTITGGTTGIKLDGSLASVTFVSASPAATLDIPTPGDYIVLTNGAMAGQAIDATSLVFDGVDMAGSPTLAQLFAIEDKITHGVDDNSLGVVYVQSDNLYVTATGSGIQSAINVANTDGTDGDTLNVQSGTYNESPNIDKSLSLVGEGRDTTTIELLAAGTPGSTYLGSVFVDAADVAIDGFTIAGNDAVGTGLANSNIIATGNADNLEVLDNRIKVGATGSGANGDDGIGILTYYNSGMSSLAASGNEIIPAVTTGYRAFYINPGVTDFDFISNEILGEFASTAITQADDGLVQDNVVTGTGNSAGLGTWGYPDADSGIGATEFVDNTISDTARAISIYGTDDVVIGFNTLTDNGIGVAIYGYDYGAGGSDGSEVTITDNLQITGGNTGILIDGAYGGANDFVITLDDQGGSVTPATITGMTDPGDFYIQLANGALDNETLDINDLVFDAGIDLTTLEERLYHAVDDLTLGQLVYDLNGWPASQVFAGTLVAADGTLDTPDEVVWLDMDGDTVLDQAAFYGRTGFETIGAAVLGVNTDTTSGTVLAAAETFTENVVIDREDITVRGHAAGTTLTGRISLGSDADDVTIEDMTVLGNSTWMIVVTGDDVANLTLSDLTLDGQDSSIRAIHSSEVNTFSGTLTLENLTVQNLADDGLSFHVRLADDTTANLSGTTFTDLPGRVQFRGDDDPSNTDLVITNTDWSGSGDLGEAALEVYALNDVSIDGTSSMTNFAAVVTPKIGILAYGLDSLTVADPTVDGTADAWLVNLTPAAGADSITFSPQHAKLTGLNAALVPAPFDPTVGQAYTPLIQTSIDYAGQDSTIEITGDTFAENLSVHDTSISFVGAAGAEIDASGGAHGVNVTGADDDVDQRTISWDNIDITGALNVGFRVDKTADVDLTLQNSEISNSGWSGFFLENHRTIDTGGTPTGKDDGTGDVIAMDTMAFTNNLVTADKYTDDITLFDFNGDLDITNVSVTSSHGVDRGGYGVQVRGVGYDYGTPTDTSEWLPAGNISIDGLIVDGTVNKVGLLFHIYSDVDTITFPGASVDMATLDSGWNDFSVQALDGTETIDIGAAQLKTINLWGATDIDATGATFYDATTGLPLTSTALADSFIIEQQVSHTLDDPTPGRGLVTWNAGNLYVPTTNSIQRAIDESTDGDTIHLAAGTFNEADISIHRDVTLLGQAGTVVDGGGTSSPVFWGDASGITLEEMTIQNATYGLRYQVSASPISNTLIDNVTMQNLASKGIEIHNDVVINGLTVQNSLFDDVGIGIRMASTATATDLQVLDTTIQNSNYGIYEAEYGSTIDNLVVDGSTFLNVYGMYVSEVNGMTITDNTFTNNLRGIYLWSYTDGGALESGDINISGNTFNNSEREAVRIITHHPLTGVNAIDDNTFNMDMGTRLDGSGVIGIRLIDDGGTSAPLAITNNTINITGSAASDVTVHGITLRGQFNTSSPTVVSGNTISGGNLGGVSPDGYADSSGILIYENESYAGQIAPGAEIDITGNEISGFDNGIGVWDATANGGAGAYGGLQTGVDIDVNLNKVTGNSEYAVRSSLGEFIDATQNWWGDPDLADIVPMMVGSVDYSDWATTDAPGGFSGITLTYYEDTDPVYVDDDWAALIDDANVIIPGTTDEIAYIGLNAFDTIQEGIDAVDVNGEVLIQPGTYVEQLVIDQNLTLTGTLDSGTGDRLTTVQAFDSMPVASQNADSTYYGTSDMFAVILVDGADEVHIDDLIVDGAKKATTNYKMVGILANESSVSVDNVEVKDISKDPPGGDQQGWGILGRAHDTLGPARTLSVVDSDILRHQKGGIYAIGEILTLTATGNTIVGPAPAQDGPTGSNGICVIDGAAATISDNTISQNWWPSSLAATGMLIYGADDVVISNNTLTNNQQGIVVVGTAKSGGTVLIDNNSIADGAVGVGIEAPSTYYHSAFDVTVAISNTTFDTNDMAIANYGVNDVDATVGNVFYDSTGALLDLGVPADNLTLEDEVYHAMDDESVGLVTWNTGEFYVTENTLGIQRAIDLASAGDTIYVGPGVFGLTDNTGMITIDKPLTILGAQAGVDPTGAGGREAGTESGETVVQDVINIKADNVTVDGLYMSYYNAYPAHGTTALYTGGLGTDIAGLTIENTIVVNSTGTPTSGAGIMNESGTNLSGTVQNNVFDGLLQGLYLNPESASPAGVVSISGNNFDEVGVGVAGLGGTDGVSITNNVFTDYVYEGVGMDNNGGVPNNLTITGNTFDTVHTGAWMLAQWGATPATNADWSGNSFLGAGGAVMNAAPSVTDPAVVQQNWWGTTDIDDIAELMQGFVDFGNWATDSSFGGYSGVGLTLYDGTDPVYVDDAWAGLVDDTNLVIPGTYVPSTSASIAYMGLNAFETVQEGANAVDAGGTVLVQPGTYTEQVTIGQSVIIQGAGSGSTTVTASAAIADSKEGVIQFSTDVSDVSLQGLTVAPVGIAGISVGRFTEGNGVTVTNLSLNDVPVTGTMLPGGSPASEQERGLYVDLTSTINGLIITDSAFDNLMYGWYLQKSVSADTSTVTGVSVSDTSFSNNLQKALYAEKLNDATFDNVTVANNASDTDYTGVGYFAPWGAGIDLNLKAGTYGDINVVNSTFTNNGTDVDVTNGSALLIKARGSDNPSGTGGTDSSYTAFPASLSNVLVAGNTFSGNKRDVVVGEYGKNNVASDVSLNGNSLTGTVVAGESILNNSAADVDANFNWFGANDSATVQGAVTDANVGITDYDLWLDNAGQVVPIPSSPTLPLTDWTDELWTDGSTSGGLQTGLDTVSDGGTLHLTAGTYGGGFTISDKSMTIYVEDTATLTDGGQTVFTIDSGAGADVDEVTIYGGGNLTIDGEGAARGMLISGDVDVKIEGTRFTNGFTQSTGTGAGLRVQGATLQLVNSLVDNNIDGTGGGLAIYAATVDIVNSTIAKNKGAQGGGIFMASGTVNVENSIVAGNLATDSDAYFEAGHDIKQAGGTLSITNSIVGSVDGLVTYTSSDSHIGNFEPTWNGSAWVHQLTDPNTGDDAEQGLDQLFADFANDDFSLVDNTDDPATSWVNFAIDGGDTDIWDDLDWLDDASVSTDIAGEDRLDGTIDIGAYEF